MDISKTLKSIGLSRSEIKIFLFLLKSGPSSIKNVSRGTFIAKTNCYYVFRQLLSKKLISKILLGDEVSFEVVDPDVITKYVEGIRTIAKDALPELSAAFYSGPSKVQSVYFDKPEDLERVFFEIRKSLNFIFVGPRPSEPSILAKNIREMSQDASRLENSVFKYSEKLKTHLLLFDDKIAIIPASSKPQMTLLQNRDLQDSLIELIKCFT